MGGKIASHLLDKGLVQSFDDVFTLTEGDFLTLPGFAEVSAKKAVEAIRAAAHSGGGGVSLARLITGLSIPHVGEETARDLADAFQTIEKLRSATREEFLTIHGVGEIVADVACRAARSGRHSHQAEPIAEVQRHHADAVEATMARLVRPPDPVDLILTAGAASTDPLDACFVAIAALGGRIVRRGVPAHPGSMLWLARIGKTAILGLPTCGAYSKATAADLLLPRLLSGDDPSERTVAKLGHGGILTRSQRFRFPAYARELDAPDG